MYFKLNLLQTKSVKNKLFNLDIPLYLMINEFIFLKKK